MRSGSLGLRRTLAFSVPILVFLAAVIMVAPASAAPTTTATTDTQPTAASDPRSAPATTVITAPLFADEQEQQRVLDQARQAADRVEDQVQQIEDLSAQVPGGLPVVDEARQHADEVQRRLAEMQSLTDTISEKQGQVLLASAELDVMDEELATVVEEYNRRMIELEEARYEAERLKGELTLAQQQLGTLNEALENRVVGTYKTKSSALEVLLETTDLKDFVKRVRLMMNVAEDDRERLDEMDALRARVDRLLDQLSRRIYDVTLTSEQLEEQRGVIEAKMAERQAYIDQLSAEIRDLVDQQRDLAQNIVPQGLDLASYLTGDGNVVVKTALKYLGIPYVWGGETPSGFDCSGLVLYVFRQHGVYLPHYSRYQATMGYAVPRGQAVAGDLVFFGSPVHHVGIYMGDDMFIHAPRTGDVVKISRLSDRSDLTHVRRFTFSPVLAGLSPATPDPAATAATPAG